MRLTRKSHQLAYCDRQSARIPLVLAPGLDGSGALFGPIIDALGAGFTPHIVRYTDGLHPFASHVDHVCAVIDRIGAPLLLLGESFGGPVAVAATVRRPEQVKALVLVATFVTRPHWSTPYIRPFFRAITAIPWPRNVLKAVLRFLLATPNIRATLMDKVVEVNGHERSALLAHRTGLTAQVDQRDALRNVHIPVAYLGGTADRIVPCTQHARIIQSLGADLRVTLLEGAPHMLLQCRPTDCARAIRELASAVDWTRR